MNKRRTPKAVRQIIEIRHTFDCKCQRKGKITVRQIQEGIQFQATVIPKKTVGVVERADLHLAHCTYLDVPYKNFSFIGDDDKRCLDPYLEEVQWEPSHSHLDYEQYGYCEWSVYNQCAHCDHFIEPDGTADLYRHLDDGEQSYDHDAEPSSGAQSIAEWMEQRPDLFVRHSDGKVGPNSGLHRRRGKIDLWDH